MGSVLYVVTKKILGNGRKLSEVHTLGDRQVAGR